MGSRLRENDFDHLGTERLGRTAGIDAILVAARSEEVPPALKHQLEIGGKLVIPIGGEDVQQLLCITRSEGKLRWVSRLARFRKDKPGKNGKPGTQKGPILWAGPVLASERLWVAGSNRELVALDAASPGREDKANDELSPAALATRVVLADCARTLVQSGTWVGATLTQAPA